MKLVLALILIPLVLLSCAKDNDSPTKVSRPRATEVKPLTEDEKLRLITPTVYHVPFYDQTTPSCEAKKNFKGLNGKIIATVCKEVYDSCALQGTCRIQVGSEKLLVNVAGRVKDELRFAILKNSICSFGKGASHDQIARHRIMCLDPYYSVAADLSIYNLGDVIHIPSIAGIQLPDGSFHDGYFVVRDTGDSIKGPGRFDFFTGFATLNKFENPLILAGLGDKNTHLSYYRITGPEAEEILKKRSFPLLPVSQ